MVGRRGHRGGRQARQDSPYRERDLRDIEMDDLRRQVQQLQRRLESYEPLEHDDPHHETENDESYEEDENPFGGGNDRVSDDENDRRRRHHFQQNFDIKVDIPEFEGKMQHEEFMDWINTVERILEL